MTETPIMTVAGYSGTVEVYENRIRLVYNNGLMMMSIRGKWAPKDIFIRNISSVQVKEPSAIVAGFMQFSISGSMERRGGGLWGGITDAQKDENSVCFRKPETANFLKVRDYLNEKIATMSAPTATVVQQLSPADEIAKLADLKAKGILTEEEFAAKKSQLLGL